MLDRKVLGGLLEPRGPNPLTCLYRDSCRSTGTEDLGWRTICAVERQRSLGTDVSTQLPLYRFPGLQPGQSLVCHRLESRRCHDDGVPTVVDTLRSALRLLDLIELSVEVR